VRLTAALRTALVASLGISLGLLAPAAFAEDPLASPWREVAPGVLAAQGSDIGADSRWGARLLLADPLRVRLSVQFDPQTPRLAEWRARFPDALAIANGSYYSLEQTVRPTCDLITAGKLMHGAGCRVKDALYFGAQASSPAGPMPRILAPPEFLATDWSEALKSFPALVHHGIALCASPGYCAEASRTAAIAILRDGHLLFFATQWPAVRRDVAKFLAEEMGAIDALNLDGGPEATLALKGEPLLESIATPGTPLPLVIAILPAPAPPIHPALAPAAPAPPVQPPPASKPAPGAGRR
jgi:hypothetical protein